MARKLLSSSNFSIKFFYEAPDDGQAGLKLYVVLIIFIILHSYNKSYADGLLHVTFIYILILIFINFYYETC
jgi:hypothetical protein